VTSECAGSCSLRATVSKRWTSATSGGKPSAFEDGRGTGAHRRRAGLTRATPVRRRRSRSGTVRPSWSHSSGRQQPTRLPVRTLRAGRRGDRGRRTNCGPAGSRRGTRGCWPVWPCIDLLIEARRITLRRTSIDTAADPASNSTTAGTVRTRMLSSSPCRWCGARMPPPESPLGESTKLEATGWPNARRRPAVASRPGGGSAGAKGSAGLVR
jgi:hypothetical protein